MKGTAEGASASQPPSSWASRRPPSQGTLQEALRPAWSSWMPMGTLYYRGHRGMAAEIFQFDATGLVTRSLATYALA
jgi:hypothetical protein